MSTPKRFSRRAPPPTKALMEFFDVYPVCVAVMLGCNGVEIGVW